MLLLVVVDEAGGCVVVTTGEHAGRRLLFLDYAEVQFSVVLQENGGEA